MALLAVIEGASSQAGELLGPGDRVPVLVSITHQLFRLGVLALDMQGSSTGPESHTGKKLLGVWTWGL